MNACYYGGRVNAPKYSMSQATPMNTLEFFMRKWITALDSMMRAKANSPLISHFDFLALPLL
jgi:hypothetical protein